MENTLHMNNADRAKTASKRNREDSKVKPDEKNYPKGNNFTRPGLVNKTGTDSQHLRILANKQQKDDEPDYQKYNFKDSGDGKSWLLGDDSGNWANAFKGGYQKCPVDIIVPRELKNEKGETRPVEVIGDSAYHTCGLSGHGDKTKTVFITKQVRIIKPWGFGSMYNVESFRIEEGSVLQSIEQDGLNSIGYNTGRDDAKKRGTLTLPSTLSSVASDGIYDCNLFKIIIYCGIHSLTEECELEYEVNEKTKVRVINQYSADTIFGQTPLKDTESQAEVIEKCFGMSGNPFEKKCKNSPENKVLSVIPLLCILISYSSSEEEDWSLHNVSKITLEVKEWKEENIKYRSKMNLLLFSIDI